jgi:hypothetical protein
MGNAYATSRPRTYRDLGAEARDLELKSLGDRMLKPDPITPHALSEWVSGSDDRTALLEGTAWGAIRWPKALGRPKSASITEAFVVGHQVRTGTLLSLPGGSNTPSYGDWSDAQAPSVWDASLESEYRVAFMFHAKVNDKNALGLKTNKLTFTFSSVRWQRGPLAAPGTFRIDPFAWSDFASSGERKVFPDFEVVSVPYRIDRFIQPLGPSRDF